MAKTIIDAYGNICILSNEKVHPTTEWLRKQSIPPLPSGNWYVAYPLTGGSVNVQEGNFRILRKTTEKDFRAAVLAPSVLAS